ncbi:MAG: tRNA uridine-5-carboxymethylaminomethyl(34) synthesis GTPase MnmE [Deltaproteobacteria bacterium CG11_big_fil_rev_8_21_14_0_20_47_16]|nr:MAG: tRNA uridine-5-carboxymethylaminomethyl(34) synthesis GTPase MnmE [Deltaproteobacteria bacterium CG11_big_fil_rev_8_21_14_0_20_47_16]
MGSPPMKTPLTQDTIAAIATPPGVGAIAIVRLSGPQSRRILGELWISSCRSVENMETHRFYYGKIRKPALEIQAISPDIHTPEDAPSIIDEVMVVCFEAPRSYTGEDMVELYCHGGSVVVQEVLAACLDAGTRLAHPGEFTRRAFLNGKMDLAQAEAVASIIHAGSESARRHATEQLSGRLSQIIHQSMSSLTQLRAFVEATIDFPEEDIEMIAHAGIKERLLPIQSQLGRLAETYHAGRLLKDGARVVLVGAPNVGKSSLMNALLGQDRSIVHDVPGTTRDYVDAAWNLNGIVVHLTDTAGLRSADETVERIGIERSHQKMEEADLVLVICDGSRPLNASETEFIKQLDPERSLVVMNKSDLPKQCELSETISISAQTGAGMPELQEALCARLLGSGPQDVEGVTITALRHKQALDEALEALTAASNAVIEASSSEFVAHHLTQASQALGEIVGEVTTDELLGEIFGKFCIGK